MARNPQDRNRGGGGPAQLAAPFRFARVNRWIYEPDWAPLVSHDVPFADGLCGEAEVEITAKSSILVGGGRRKPNDEAGEVRPFRLPDGGYAIPGSALQGMARAILEVAAFGRLGPWVENRKFGIRDLSATETAERHYRSRLKSKAGWLVRISKTERRIVPCKFARIGLSNVLDMKRDLPGEQSAEAGVLYRKSDAGQRYKWFLPDPKDGKAALDARFSITSPGGGGVHARCEYDPRGRYEGTLVFTGKPQDSVAPRSDDDMRRGHKRREFVFYCPDRASASTAESRLPVPDDAWTAFRSLHDEQPGREENPNWTFWKREFMAGRSVPVFYWEDEDDPGCVETLGMAYAFKAAHRKSARDLLEHSCPGHVAEVSKMKLDLPHLLFGVAAEHDDGRGLKRRANFGLARAEGDPRPVEPGHPSVLLGPKPSYVGFYVRQKEGDGRVPGNEPMATYTPLEEKAPHLARPELAGVKIWPARGAGRFTPKRIDDEKIRRNLKIQTSLFALPPGTRFRSRLNFHNLRPVELGALLWALSFGDEAAFGADAGAVTKRHRLGMGKPLGLGEVAIRVAGLKTEPACPARAPGLPEDAMGFVRAFAEHMRGACGGQWSESKQVAALLKAADPERNDASDLRYATLKEYQVAKNEQLYMPDYAPDGDDIDSGGAPAADLPLEVGARVRVKPGGPANLRNREGVVEKLGATEYAQCQVRFDGASRPESVRPGLLQVTAPPSDSHTD